MNKRVYLDYAATAPLLPEVRAALCEHYAFEHANAATLYQEGREARRALEGARVELAGLLACAPQELYFCSGGTEAIGSLIEGIARGALSGKGERRARKHIICAAFEHHAALDSALSLKRDGFEVELLRPNRAGRITPESLEAALRPDTLMVVVMLAQNEVGTVQDIACLAQLAHDVGALLVSDCVQAFCKVPISLADLEIDAACFSAHKMGGPFGVGAFYLHPSTPFLARQLGGGQERKLRSGTQNVPGALGFALAAQLQTKWLQAGLPQSFELATGNKAAVAPLGEAMPLGEDVQSNGAVKLGEAQRLAALRDELLSALVDGSRRVRATVPIAPGCTTSHLPGYLHLLVRGIESQTMVLKLDELGFAVSGGSACSSSSLAPSHVLTSMGIAKDEAFGALRISMGRGTTPEDCTRFAAALLSIL